MNLRQAAQQALKVMDDHMYRADTHEFYEAKEALRAALAEPEQQPVAWEQFYPDIGKPQTTHWEGCEAVHPECKTEQAVATWENKYGMKEWQVHAIRAGWMPAPTPRKPLTVFEIDAIAEHLDKTTIGWATHEFAAAVERAHGIGKQT